MGRRFNLLVFDWDGTLMDSQARIVHSMQGALADAGLAPLAPHTIANIIGLGLTEALSELLPNSDAHTLAKVRERYRHHFLFDSQVPTPLFPEVRETLASLVELGYLLAVATGKSRTGLDRVLAQSDCARFFDATRCADEAPSKPNPDMLLEIMAELGVAPHETLMIGDTDYDLLMAQYASTSALAVSYGVHDRERLWRCQPLACVDSVSEIGAWLRDQNVS